MWMKKSLQEYLDQYAAEHTKLGTKLTHFVGIPLIVASLPVLPFNPALGAGMFVGGWALQYLGHTIEGNSPAFYGDFFYLLVGPLWVAIEVAELLGFQVTVPDIGPAVGEDVAAAAPSRDAMQFS